MYGILEMVSAGDAVANGFGTTISKLTKVTSDPSKGFVITLYMKFEKVKQELFGLTDLRGKEVLNMVELWSQQTDSLDEVEITYKSDLLPGGECLYIKRVKG